MKARTVRDVAAIARDRRVQLGWSQAQLAEKLGVGREWVIHFEKGKATVEWGIVLRVLRELGLSMDLGTDAATSREGGDEIDRILDLTTGRGGRR